MTSLRLYAETPRAGQYGHRFLIPEGVSVSESEVVAAFSSAKEGVSFGRDHIAVGRKVKQLSLGGTTRDGLEVIVLTGLNAATLPDCLFNQLVEVLRRHSLSLESLVLTGIDWGKVLQDAIIVPSAEMRDWLSELERVTASEANWSAKLVSHASTNSSVKRNGSTDSITLSAQRIALVGGLMLFFGTFIGVTLGWIAKNVTKAPSTDTPKVVEHSEFGSQNHLANDAEFRAADKRTGPNPYAVHFKEMIEKAIREPKPSSFINTMSLWPYEEKFPDSATVYEALLDRCTADFDEKKFDDVLMLLKAISDRASEFPRDSNFEGSFNDLRDRAIEGANGLKSLDQKAYESIRSKSGRIAVDAAREYHSSGARRTMRKLVDEWIKWAESPVILDIKVEKLQTQGPCRIFVEFEGKTAGLILDDVNTVTTSSPLSISLSSLGISMCTLPCECNLYIENQIGSTTKSRALQSAFATISDSSARSAAKLLLDGSSGRQWKIVELSSGGGLLNSTEKISVRITNFEDAPKLPNWDDTYQ
jgi:hypothetical protein